VQQPDPMFSIMNRREFIKSVIAGIITSQIPIDIQPSSTPVSLFGIPYHEFNATSGTWLGIERSLSAQWISHIPADAGTLRSLTDLIKILQNDKKRS